MRAGARRGGHGAGCRAHVGERGPRDERQREQAAPRLRRVAAGLPHAAHHGPDVRAACRAQRAGRRAPPPRRRGIAAAGQRRFGATRGKLAGGPAHRPCPGCSPPAARPRCCTPRRASRGRACYWRRAGARARARTVRRPRRGRPPALPRAAHYPAPSQAGRVKPGPVCCTFMGACTTNVAVQLRRVHARISSAGGMKLQ